MKELYDSIAEEVSYRYQDGYSFEKAKSLPYKIDAEKIIKELATEFERTVTSIKSLNILYNIDSYLLTYSTNIQESANSIKRSKMDRIVSNHIDLVSSQLINLCKENNINVDEFEKTINFLKNDANSKSLFLTRSKDFIQQYVDIESQLQYSLEIDDDKAFYIEALKELRLEYNDVFELCDHYEHYDLSEFKRDYIGLISEFNQIMDKQRHIAAVEVPTVALTEAELFALKSSEMTGNEISDFLVEKDIGSSITHKIKLTDSQKIQSFYLFNDTSIAYKKDGKYKAVQSMNDLKTIGLELEESIIMYSLRKKPSIAKIFLQKYREDVQTPFNFSIGMATIKTVLDHEQILKNMKFDFNLFKELSFEGVDDQMNSMINKYKLNQYANSILSNKYKHLLSDNALESFKILKESGVSEKSLQTFVGKKIAAIQDHEQFSRYLDKVVDHFSGFSPDILLDKLATFDLKPVYNKDDVIVFQVCTFEQSKALGSPAWCIARENSYFNDYTSENSIQYFMYDFTKSEKDSLSMIGFTTYQNGDLRAKHLKDDDDYYNMSESFRNIVDNVIYNNRIAYSELSDELLETLEDKFGEKVNKNKLKANNI